MTLLLDILLASRNTFLMAAPWLLVGLMAAGLLHVLIRRETLARWLGRPGFVSVIRGALFGVPLPVCSCGVVPLAIAVRQKGASKPASLSFLITTPESGADSVAVTFGMLGPVMAVARPVASFVTAVATGAMAIAFGEGRSEQRASESGLAAAGVGETADPTGCCSEQAGSADAPAVPSTEADGASCCATAGPAPRAASAAGSESSTVSPMDLPLWRRLPAALEYGFVRLLDGIAFWLVVGVVLTGVISAVLPDDLSTWGVGGGLLPMLAILVAAVPMYVCASASTPIAAVLIAKGLSPGAALVFLLAGPATNAASLLVLTKTFGARLVRIYLLGILLGSLACGVALDLLVGWTGWRVVSRMGADGMAMLGPIEWAAGAVLGLLLVWRLVRGAGAAGWREFRDGVRWPLQRLRDSWARG